MTALHNDKGGSFSMEPGMLIVNYDMYRMEKVDAVRLTRVFEHID